MAIIENRSTEIGDVLVIKAEIPVLGIIALSTFIDDVSGETGTRLFEKSFRYTLDGINYTDILPLTTANVDAIDVQPSDIFIVEYFYTRAGTDTEGVLTWNFTELQGDIQPVDCGPEFKKSIFYQFFTCTNVEALGWAINVLEKVYKNGIVPLYIERGINFTKDKDYIDFWFSITTIFAYLVYYARNFQNFSDSEDLLTDYLLQSDVFLCRNESLIDLKSIQQNLIQQFHHRGTYKIKKIPESTPYSQIINQPFFESINTFWIEDNPEGAIISDVSFDVGGGVRGYNRATFDGVISTPNIFTIGKRYRVFWTFNTIGGTADDDVQVLSGTQNVLPSGYFSNINVETGEPEEFGKTIDFDFIAEEEYLVFDFANSGTEVLTGLYIKEVVDGPIGELRRLLCIEDCEDLVFAMTRPNNSAWYLNNTSPLWKGLNHQSHINRSYEDGDVTSLNAYPLIGKENLSIVDDSGNSIRILKDSPNTFGIGGLDSEDHGVNLKLHGIKVDPLNNYIVEFDIKQTQLENALTFKILAFDQAGNKIQLINSRTGGITSNFFVQKSLNKDDLYYNVRGIIWNLNQDLLPSSDSRLNIGFGDHLKFSLGTCIIVPQIVLEGPENSEAYIRNIRIRPLDSQYSSGGILGVGPITRIIGRNNNLALTEEEVEKNIRQKLINYNSHLLVDYIN